MYILQETPDPFYILDSSGEKGIPLATLKSEHGGIAHIDSDDGCLVLLTTGASSEAVDPKEQRVSWATHWFPEALAAQRLLLDRSEELKNMRVKIRSADRAFHGPCNCGPNAGCSYCPDKELATEMV